MSTPSIPSTYHIYPHISGGMLHDTQLSGTVTSNVNANVYGDKNKPIATLLIGDSNQPISTDSKVELLNLPRFTLDDIKDMMKVRMRIPNYSQICFKMFGVEFFSICMNGEGQVITEPYKPNALELCEDDCCEPDTRPFPEPRKGDDDTRNPNG
jgi:hypothetical protein